MSSKPELHPITRDIDMTPDQRKTARRAVGGSAVGNAIEWFDIGIYAYLAVYISQLFFTFSDDGGALPLILTFLTFAISYLVRPLGAIVLGPLGDKVGRQKVLVMTIMLITVATTLIGVLPTYSSVGFLAPILLILLRMVQGFSAGGEYAGAAVFMAEHAPDNRRGFYGSFLEFGTLAGFSAAAVLCTSLTLVVGADGMLAGWWRLPFLVCLPLGAIALWIRNNLEESDTFTEVAAEQEVEKESAWRALRNLIVDYPGQVVKLIGFVILINVAFYLVLTYMPAYLQTTLSQDDVQATFALVIIQLVMMVIIIPFGHLSDKIGRKPLLITASLGFMILSVPAMMLIQLDTGWSVLLGIGILGVFLAMIISNISATLPALFPTSVRYSGFAIGYNVSTAIFGGTAAAVNTFLIDKTGNELIPGWYLAVAGLIGFIAVLSFNETAGRSLRGDVIPGDDDQERLETGEILIGKINVK